MTDRLSADLAAFLAPSTRAWHRIARALEALAETADERATERDERTEEVAR